MITLPVWLMAALGWLRTSWKAIVLALATAGLWLLYRKGRSDERRRWQAREAREAERIRERGDEAKADAARRVGALGDDDLDRELRHRGALRDR